AGGAHGPEASGAAFIAPRSLGSKGTEPLVFPQDVIAPLDAVCDPQPSLAGQANQAAVSQKRAEDLLELDWVRRQPAERRGGTFDHTDQFDHRLRRPGLRRD